MIITLNINSMESDPEEAACLTETTVHLLQRPNERLRVITDDTTVTLIKSLMAWIRWEEVSHNSREEDGGRGIKKGESLYKHWHDVSHISALSSGLILEPSGAVTIGDSSSQGGYRLNGGDKIHSHPTICCERSLIGVQTCLAELLVNNSVSNIKQTGCLAPVPARPHDYY